MSYEIIREPGKFEGELSIVPAMWECVLEGFGAEVYSNGVMYSFVCLLSVDEPIDKGLYGACLWERSDGFVMSEWYATEQEYMKALTALENASESEEQD